MFHGLTALDLSKIYLLVLDDYSLIYGKELESVSKWLHMNYPYFFF